MWRNDLKLPYTPILIISENVHSKINESLAQGFPFLTGKAEEICASLNLLKNAMLDNPIVVGDISPKVAGHDIEQCLLKVLEGLTVDVMFLSSMDSFSSTFLSRFAVVFKDDEIIESGFNSRSAFVQIMQAELPKVEALKKIIKECPGFLPFFESFHSTHMPGKIKLLEFLK
jgi:hypothetical protein